MSLRGQKREDFLDKIFEFPSTTSVLMEISSSADIPSTSQGNVSTSNLDDDVMKELKKEKKGLKHKLSQQVVKTN